MILVLISSRLGWSGFVISRRPRGRTRTWSRLLRGSRPRTRARLWMGLWSRSRVPRWLWARLRAWFGTRLRARSLASWWVRPWPGTWTWILATRAWMRARPGSRSASGSRSGTRSRTRAFLWIEENMKTKISSGHYSQLHVSPRMPIFKLLQCITRRDFWYRYLRLSALFFFHAVQFRPVSLTHFSCLSWLQTLGY